MDWIIQNKEWLFSGIAISIPLFIIGRTMTSNGNKQKQKGGTGSINIQVAGDLNLGKERRGVDE